MQPLGAICLRHGRLPAADSAIVLGQVVEPIGLGL